MASRLDPDLFVPINIMAFSYITPLIGTWILNLHFIYMRTNSFLLVMYHVYIQATFIDVHILEKKGV